MQTREVERIACKSLKEFFREIRPSRCPVVLTEAVDHWPAMQLWTHDYLADTLGSLMVPCERANLFDCVTVNDKGSIQRVDRPRIPLSQAISAMREPNSIAYVTEWQALEESSHLRSQVGLDSDDLFAHKNRSPMQMYIGSQKSYTPLHFDRAPNFTTHIRGSKTWKIFAPRDSKYLYPYPRLSQMGHFTHIHTKEDMNDFNRFPKLRNAVCWETEVHPGEIIYIPEYWWHSVSSIDETISLHFFFKTPLLRAKQALTKPLNWLLRRRFNSDSNSKN
ncbi:MAG: cupin-like domain-containing protein [Planctomycetales bacterium]|nr:cupin-like domain-containing protein [Planctomycetales bacterium]